MRSLLVSTGTAQTGTNHIGPLPNLHAAFDSLAIRPKTEFVWTAVAGSLAGDYTVIDTWQVIGLAGTGSKDVEVNDVLVPAYRTLAAERIRGAPTAAAR